MIPLHDDNPTTRPPIVTYILIGLCLTAFLIGLMLSEFSRFEAIHRLGVVPAVLHGVEESANGNVGYFTLVSHMALHSGWLHLGANMLSLWIFGDDVEDATGRARFVIFIAVCGAAAALTHAVAAPDSQAPMIGASGAIAGVMGAYMLLFPRARVIVLVPVGIVLPLRIPALPFIAGWFALQIVNLGAFGAVGGGAGEQVAWAAHVGGFLAGVALLPLLKRKDIRLFAPAAPARPMRLAAPLWARARPAERARRRMTPADAVEGPAPDRTAPTPRSRPPAARTRVPPTRRGGGKWY